MDLMGADGGIHVAQRTSMLAGDEQPSRIAVEPVAQRRDKALLLIRIIFPAHIQIMEDAADRAVLRPLFITL